MKITSGFVSVTTSDGEMEVYFSRPDSMSSLPGLVVFQEAFGVNEHIQDVCDMFAREGYAVFSPELYHRKGKHLKFGYTGPSQAMELLRGLSEKQLCADIGALIDHMKKLSEVESHKIATVGFCVGGYVSILAAIHFKIQASISFYGAGLVHQRSGFGIGPLKKELKNIKCPVMLIFGEQDSSIPFQDINEIQKQLEENHIDYKCLIFQQASHGFFCDQRASYHEKSAQEAWSKTLEFLKEKVLYSEGGDSSDSASASGG